MKKVKNIFGKKHFSQDCQCRSYDLGLCNAERQTQQVKTS